MAKTSIKRSNEDDDDNNNKNKTLNLLIQFASIGSKPTPKTFPQLIDCVIWMRFSLALLYGFYLVITEASGSAIKLIMGLNVVTFVPYFYCKFVLLADESFGMGLVFQGTPNALALIVLIWIYGYSLAHEGDEERLSKLMLEEVVVGGGDATAEAVAEATQATAAAAAVEEEVIMEQESEF